MQIAILVLIVGTISFLFRDSGSTFRYWLWSIVVLRMCIPVQVNLPVRFEDMTHHWLPEGISSTLAQIAPARGSISTVSDQSAPVAVFHFPSIDYSLVFYLWIGIVSILFIFIALRVGYLHYTLKKSAPITRNDFMSLLESLRRKLHIKPEVKLYFLDFDPNSGPALVGFFRPKIFLPYSMAKTWTAKEIRPILVHELVHIKRHDQLFNWIQIFVQIIYFFHPLVWYANWRARHYREESCDDYSIQILEYKTKRYSECIFNSLQESGKESLWGFTHVGFSERRNSLAKRIVRILDKEYKANIRISVKMILAFVFVVIVSFLISCNSIVGIDPDIQDTPRVNSVARGATDYSQKTLSNSTSPDSTGYKHDIYLSSDGIMFLNDVEISLEELKMEMDTIREKANTIRILADNNTNKRILNSINAVLSQNGIARVQVKYR